MLYCLIKDLPFATQEGGLLLDNITLEARENITPEKFIESLDRIEKKEYEEIFNREPSRFLLQAKTKRKQFKNYQALGKLEKMERALYPIVKDNGDRNKKYLKLVFAYYCTGLNEQEAAIRIKSNMLGAGGDYEIARIEKQIQGSYKKFKNGKYTQQYKKKIQRHDIQLDLFLEAKVKELVERSPYRNKGRKKSLTYFTLQMYNWRDYVINLKNDDRAYLDFLYPYFRHNTKVRGLIPLPKALLHNWNERYYEFIPFLKKEGIIELKQNYSTDLGVCNYFTINEL